MPNNRCPRRRHSVILRPKSWRFISADENHAVVIARMSRKGHDIDVRWLERVSGRWLNEGNGTRRLHRESP